MSPTPACVHSDTRAARAASKSANTRVCWLPAPSSGLSTQRCVSRARSAELADEQGRD